MNLVDFTIGFSVQGLPRPTPFDFDFGFLLYGLPRPTFTDLDFGFGVKGTGLPTIIDADVSFAVSAPDPNIYAFDRGAWQPVAQRVWTGTEWYPGV